MASDPYRTTAEKVEEPWYVQHEPSDLEREVWVEFCKAFIVSPRIFQTKEGATSPSLDADEMMLRYRERFGVSK